MATTIFDRAPRLARVLRLGISSGAATMVDTALLFVLVHATGFAPGPAALLGSLAGGAVNFAINRRWVFAVGGGWLGQALRYFAIVVGGGAVVSAAAVAALCALGLPLLIAKGAAVLITMAAWTYPMASRVVFAPGVRSEPTVPAPLSA